MNVTCQGHSDSQAQQVQSDTDKTLGPGCGEFSFVGCAVSPNPISDASVLCSRSVDLCWEWLTILRLLLLVLELVLECVWAVLCAAESIILEVNGLDEGSRGLGECVYL